MEPMQLSERRVDELVAAFAVFRERLTDVTSEYHRAAEAAVQPEHEEDDCQEAGSAVLQLAGRSCSGVLLCKCGSLQATLVFDMPPGYPAAAAIRCHVTSPQLPRDVIDALSQQLQEQAEDLQGAECLHELADTLQQQLEQLAQRQQVHSPTSQLTSTSQQQCVETAAISASSGGSSNSANEPVGRLLLRLDHMRSKASYSRTIKQWAAKLNLTGFLLFWQSLILILLEGCPSDLAQYLYLARTVCVDVDASGRKCRERMMTVLEDSSSTNRSSSSSKALSGSGSSSNRGCVQGAAQSGDADGGSGMQGSGSIGRNINKDGLQHGRGHTDFRVLEVADLADVVQLLEPTHPQYTRTALLALLGRKTS